MPVRARLIGVALCLVVAGASIHSQAAAQGGAEGEPFTTVPAPGFNLVGWVEAETTPGELFADLPEAESVFAWDALAGRFLSARRVAPPALNSLERLLPGQGFWLGVASDGPVEWVRTRGTPIAPLPLRPGNNLVGWLGQDGMEVEAAVASVGVALETVLGFNTESGGFDRFAPSLPAALNSLASLEHGSAVWVQTCRSATWDQGRGGRSGRRLGGDIALCLA